MHFIPSRRLHEDAPPPRRRRHTILAAALAFLCACDPITAGVTSVGAVATGKSLCDGLEAVIDRLDQAIYDQRAGMKTDVLEVVAGTREQLETVLQDLHAVASALEEKVAADLAGQVSVVIQSTDKLVRDINAAANETIRSAAEQLKGTIDKVQNGPLREAKATARIMLANGQRTADGIVLSVMDGVTLLVIRIGGGLVLLAGAIGLIISAIKRSTLGLGVTCAIAGLGLAAIIFAPYLGKIGARTVTIPDPEAACDVALREGAKLEQALAAPAQARAASAGLEGGSAGILRAIRGGKELRLVEMFPAAPTAGVPPRPALDPPGKRLSLSHVVPGTAGPTLDTRPWFGERIALPGGSTPRPPGGTPVAPTPATAATIDAAAAAVRAQAPICIAYSASPQKADACERYLNEALAYMGVAIVCTSSAQCPQQQWCDEHTASCLPLGVYCQRADHCGTGKECDTSLNRCVAEATFTCSSAAPCRPGQVCANGRCGDASHVIGQPCLDTTKLGPCMQGTLQADGHGGVVCVSVVSKTTEVCDGIDNDCNGTVDEGLGGETCAAAALGICANGRRACRGGRWTCDPGPSRAETCNDVDDNCNGSIDDDPSCGTQKMTGGSIGCGNAVSNDAQIGAPCPGFEREDCFADPGQLQSPGNGGHAEAVGWVSNNPQDCRCKVHCGTDYHWDPFWHYTWKFTITAHKRDFR